MLINVHMLIINCNWMEHEICNDFDTKPCFNCDIDVNISRYLPEFGDLENVRRVDTYWAEVPRIDDSLCLMVGYVTSCIFTSRIHA